MLDQNLNKLIKDLYKEKRAKQHPRKKIREWTLLCKYFVSQMTYQSGRWFAYFNLFILHCTLIYLQSILKRKRRTHSEIKVIKTDHPHNNNTNLLLCMNTGYLSYFRYMLELKIKGFITCCFFPLRDEQVESSLTLNKHAGIHFSNNYLDKVWERTVYKGIEDAIWSVWLL